MARKKIEFTEEQNGTLTILIGEGKPLEEIVKLFNEKYSTSYAYETIRKHIKTLGIERRDKRGDNSRALVYDDLDKKDLVRYMAAYTPERQIAKEMSTTVKSVERAIKRHNITYKDIKSYNDNDFIHDLGDFDMRSLKKDIFERMWRVIVSDPGLKSRGIEVIPNATIEVDGSKLMVDFYVPKLNRGYVCTVNDPDITEDGKHLCKVRKVVRLINQRCSTNYRTNYKEEHDCNYEYESGDGDVIQMSLDYVPTTRKISYKGLYVEPFTMVTNPIERRYEIEGTAKRIVGDILSLVSNNYIVKNVGGITEREILEYEKKRGLVSCEMKTMVDGGVFDDFEKLMSKTRKETMKKLKEDPEYIDKKYGF